VLPDLATPALLVDRNVLQGNIAAMAAHGDAIGVELRPHAKTHKSPDIARLQVDAGAVGLTVATVSEAAILARSGFRDLFIAYPLWVDAEKGRRIRQLLDDVTLTLGVDSVESGRALAAQLGAGSGSDDLARLSVLVEVDSGHHRSGVQPDGAGALADQLAHAGLRVRGIFTFPGHSYTPGRQQQVAEEEAVALADAVAGLAARGVGVEVVSGGSTPSAGRVAAGTMTEMRPGVYVFGDAQQWELGTVAPEAISLTCLATVVSHGSGNVVLDAGSKALGADRAAWASGFGRLLDHPEARITALSEHHAVVAWPDPALPPRGARLRVVPNHVCNAVNLADELVVVTNGEMVDRWPVTARGANT
jgi:D-serine deaminase-like pyridoxal phosphate-dependent protein